MAKRKKTREQKILAEIHRQQQVALQQQYSYSISSTAGPKEQEVKTPKISFSQTNTVRQHYEYLGHDFRKTVLVTVTIIVAQLILHAFLK
jgi:hypothetical protein